MNVSVVIPTFNHGEYVVAAIESVRTQTLPPREIIVVNDGSTDTTSDVLRPLADAGVIRLIEQTNAGQAAARNRGIEAATGDAIALLDDDDLWPADKLAWQAAALDASGDAALVYGSFRLLRGDTLEAASAVARPAGSVYDAFRRQCWIMSPGQTLIRTAALHEVGMFDTQVWGSDDWDLYLRLARRHDFVYLDRVALHYRLHAANASRQALRHARNHLKVVRRHIGWNVPLLAAHQRAASAYFTPRLREFADDARVTGRYGQAVHAQLVGLTFAPFRLLAVRWWRQLIGNLLRRPPRTPPRGASAERMSAFKAKESNA